MRTARSKGDRKPQSETPASGAQKKPVVLGLIHGRPPKGRVLGSDQRFATLPALIFLTRRSRLGLNATQFGRLLGVSGSRVADFEAGRRMPNPRHLAKLAELVGVSAEAVRTLAISALVEQILRRGASSLERLHERVVRGIESLADLRPLGQK